MYTFNSLFITLCDCRGYGSRFAILAKITIVMADEPFRCPWCMGFDDYIKYHDEEWGVPVHDDRRHFEFLILEGAQAGLSWSTILKKRVAYRKAFAEFDPEQVARFTEARVARLVLDAG